MKDIVIIAFKNPIMLQTKPIRFNAMLRTESPSHYYRVSTNQLEVLLTEQQTANQNLSLIKGSYGISNT